MQERRAPRRREVVGVLHRLRAPLLPPAMFSKADAVTEPETVAEVQAGNGPQIAGRPIPSPLRRQGPIGASITIINCAPRHPRKVPRLSRHRIGINPNDVGIARKLPRNPDVPPRRNPPAPKPGGIVPPRMILPALLRLVVLSFHDPRSCLGIGESTYYARIAV